MKEKPIQYQPQGWKVELDISECDNFYSIHLVTKKVVSISAGSVDIHITLTAFSHSLSFTPGLQLGASNTAECTAALHTSHLSWAMLSAWRQAADGAAADGEWEGAS